ncbi:GNAT family N-acetyltransferase [Streptomyces sp. HC44]|uniref:GNAT family N-acetyltransferase n=2 Tax=Streptomyces scabichelini TaxID=2711217 RepID=A0A6G4V309_9ACTN|nr:GNAT family N-acetyltransferase [Streptomyces scabichelini]
MTSDEALRIETLSPGHAEDFALMSALTALINEVYEVAEEGLWAPGTTRTSRQEVASLTHAGEITVARLDEELVGCVRIQQLTADICEFGMLAAAPKRRGTGIGRELVRFAEQYGRDAGLDVMQLELLVPREWSHPSKEFLATWYGRIGYQVVRTGSIDDSYPELAPSLATPCDFVIYHKSLRA